MHSVIILRLVCVQEFLLAVAGMKPPPFLLKADPKQAGCRQQYDASSLCRSRPPRFSHAGNRRTKVRLKPEIHKADRTLHSNSLRVKMSAATAVVSIGDRFQRAVLVHLRSADPPGLVQFAPQTRRGFQKLYLRNA